MKPSKTKTYEHAITGLLGERADLYNELIHLRARIAEIGNDMATVDKTLRILGFKDNLDDLMPEWSGPSLLPHRQLSRSISEMLREATEPLTSRQIALKIVQARCENPNDRTYMNKLTNSVWRTFGNLRKQGRVVSEGNGKGLQLWRLER
ncbi:hypothetical protein [Roseibium aggregatum]|uniref:Uncharacterized protein n=1 Tax=Roseibium aggregatum TaxID=187304 RepID=A0A926S599_9HYPH|nr:hypothetical protein [Roseibium aggregatum]MBD1545920.1 hypothetical protein [Roseibium aggregatum]